MTNVNTPANSKITRLCIDCLKNFKNPNGVKVVAKVNCTACRIAEDWRSADQKMGCTDDKGCGETPCICRSEVASA